MLTSTIGLTVALLCLQAPANFLSFQGDVRLQDSPRQPPAQDTAPLQAQAEAGGAAAQLKLRSTG